ncbi:cyclin-domain-containing protein [Epithele typhae]|uniref:cyclin-domain-containing protein n=1 Tax=Epithele typhae TaxID=378194 RepID=UPI002008981B|nr:cyclin-domain-containing protein [Epithele typhae]KAH9942334.1 cyclin-domain-containing protein [Epithele typhae]
MESPERVELPAAFEDVNVDVLVQLIADMMERLMTHNDQIPLLPESLTRFHSRVAPTISVVDYLRRIVRFTKAERVCLLITLHYIDQISVRMPAFVLSSLTCHRFVISAICVSSKCLCDVFCSNTVYAKVGGISVAELNVLEREFLRITEWKLTPTNVCIRLLAPRLYVQAYAASTVTLTLSAQCTRDVLQEYYVNLVRTFSHGTYVIADAHSSSSGLSDSDADMDDEPSLPGSPVPASVPASHAPHPRGGTILVDTATLVPPDAPQQATAEQNLAFAALQRQQAHAQAHAQAQAQVQAEALRGRPDTDTDADMSA